MPAKYSEKRNLEISGSITHGTAGHLTISSADLIALDSNQRDQLAGILKTIQSARKGECEAIEHQPAEILDAEFEEVTADEDDAALAIPY